MPTFAIDWDGTLVEHRFPAMGDWLPGAVDALKALSRKGDVIVHSCRTSFRSGGGWQAVASMLHDVGFWPALVKTRRQPNGDLEVVWEILGPGLGHPLPERPEGVRTIGIWVGEGKPIAFLYVDDRGLRFTDWETALPGALELLHDHNVGGRR